MIDIIIVGAGPGGLCAAKTVLQIQPDAQVLVLEAGPSVGGVWAPERLYPTLKTNNVWGSIDFCDYPMTTERYGVRPGEHVPGEVLSDYYRDYARDHDLLGRIRCNCRVTEVRKSEVDGGGWTVEVEVVEKETEEKGDKATAGPGRGGASHRATETLQCAKLLVATGVLSVPQMPDFRGRADFRGPIIHSSAMGAEYEAVFGRAAGEADRRTICVVGGSKSSYDAVYLACVAGHDVEWVIRRSGRGPSWLMPALAVLGPVRVVREKLSRTRAIAFMSPWAFADHSGLAWLRSALHRSAAGRFVRTRLWRAMHESTAVHGGFRDRDALRVLEPEESPFWYGTSSGIYNYDQSLFDLVCSGRIRVHRHDISHLSDGSVHLSGGPELRVDAIVAATGYSARPGLAFAPESLHASLGVPSAALDAAQRLQWSRLDAAADAELTVRFPDLVAGPPRRSRGGSAASQAGEGGAGALSPWRLYRGIAPPGLAAAGDRSLVFVGVQSNTANTIRLEAQCLWAAAWVLGHAAPAVDGAAVLADTALFQRWAQHRAPYGQGSLFPDLVFDQLPYWDLLLNDLGLRTARKRGKLRELFEPYSPRDYRGLVEEYMDKVRRRENMSEKKGMRVAGGRGIGSESEGESGSGSESAGENGSGSWVHIAGAVMFFVVLVVFLVAAIQVDCALS